MPLVSIAPILHRALEEGFAIPLFDTFDMFSAEGILRAAEEKQAPLIIAIYSGTLRKPYVRALAAYIRQRAQEISQPISLMLDHGANLEDCMHAITYGFSDVMFDGSNLPLEENIAQAAAIVRAAHAVGVSVEAELGHVGAGSEYDTYAMQRKGFTDPALVSSFVAETGVDSLAVAIGSAHGKYKGEPRIDLELLKDIRSRVDLPLVLHGGTGLSEAQFRGVIAGGIAKINVATDLFATTTARLVAASETSETNYFKLMEVAIESFLERCEYYLDLFQTSGKA